MSNESYKSEISEMQLARAHMGARMFGANPHSEYEERIAELEAENARLRAEYAKLESAFVQLADKDIAVALINLDKARLLLVAIDENLDMDVNPLTITTGRIVELLRDPASNPWASLMRAGKEGGA